MKKLIDRIRPLTLQKRMRLLIIFSTAILLIVAIAGFWKIRQFQLRHLNIQVSSAKLQEDLQHNFTATRILGNIRSNLQSYMQSANETALDTIRQDTKILRNSLPEELHHELSHLQEIVDILAIRMNSLQKNNSQIPLVEKALSTTMAQLIRDFPSELVQEVFPIVSKARVVHQKIYIRSIISGQINQIRTGQVQITEVMDEVNKQLETIVAKLPSIEQMNIVNKIQDGLYSMDEASLTVSAIRLTTLETELEIVTTIDKLKNALFQDSLDRNESSFSLMENGMAIAQQNITYLVCGLLILALLFIAVSIIISRNFILPLVDFVTLLRKLNRMMAGQRKKSSTDDSLLGYLSTFIDKRQDEIGEVALAIQDMLTNMRAISFFRQTIEADETTDEIYQRLARIFTDVLDLQMFVIYEKLRGQDSMEHVYCHPSELKDEVPEFAMADSCRAKRTGDIITSYEDPHICNIYPFPDCLDHYCIPMIVGGHVIGVVQFLFRKDLSENEKSNSLARVSEAQNFIAETLPVLESKHLAAEMEEMATKDQLTGLFNRRYLETSLDQMVAGIKRRGTTMGILMCDLDFFKQVNDSFGHDAGDAILSQLSTLLTNSVRSTDLVIRFGGEEFLIILVDCEPGQSQTIAENIRKTVEDYKFHASGQKIQKTTSIGVSEFPLTENQGIWEAIKFADVALYKAKDAGRNRVEVFEQSMWKENAC